MAGKTFKCPSCREPFVVEIQRKPASGSAKAKRRRSVPKTADADEFAAGPPPIVMGQKPKTKKREPEREDEAKDKPAAKPKKNNKVAIIAVVGVAAIVFWAGAMFLVQGVSGRGAKPTMTAPEVFERVQAQNSKFSVEHPSDWFVETGGGSGGLPTWLKMEHGDIKISIKDSLKGGVLGDIVQAGSDPNAEVPDEVAPVAALHEMLKSDAEAFLSNYNEQPPVKIETGMGDARMSEFTASEWAFGSVIYGYRATLLAGPRQFSVVVRCPKRGNWEALKPTFRRIIESIQ